jgi:hypothetical protein
MMSTAVLEREASRDDALSVYIDRKTPRLLVSLWEMLQNYLPFYEISRSLGEQREKTAFHAHGVSYQRTNWQEIINNIASRLKSMPRGPEKDFYLEVNAQFGFLKDTYRNHAEHAHDHYCDLDKAKHR